MKKRTLALPLAVLLVLLVFPTWTAPDKDPQQVEVTNFPQSQNVNGIVTVANFPQLQPVQVANLPPVQEVAGVVDVANLPLDAEGNLLVARERPFRFVGVTSQRFDGAGGWAAMTKACFDELGGRVAFSDEYRPTVNPPAIPESVWIQPSPLLSSQRDSTGNNFGNRGRTCGAWTINSSGNEGSVLLPDGLVSDTESTSNNCSVPRPIACAAQ